MHESPTQFADLAPLKRLVTEDKIVAALSISERHLRALRTRRLIPFVKLGGAIRYHPADVASAIENNLTVRATG